MACRYCLARLAECLARLAECLARLAECLAFLAAERLACLPGALARVAVECLARLAVEYLAGRVARRPVQQRFAEFARRLVFLQLPSSSAYVSVALHMATFR